MMNKEEQKKPGKQLAIAIAAVIAVLLLAAVVIGVLVNGRPTSGNNGTQPSDHSQQGDVTEPTVDENPAVSDEDELRRLLAMEQTLNITVVDDIALTAPLTVVGEKSLSGDVELAVSRETEEAFTMFDVTEGATLTVNGMSLSGGTKASGFNVSSGAKLQLNDTVVENVADYGVSVNGEAALNNLTFNGSKRMGVLVGKGSTVTISGGTLTDAPTALVSVEKSGSLTIGDGAALNVSDGDGILNRGTAIVNDVVITYCMGYGINNYGDLTVDYTGTEPDGMVEMGSNGKGAIYNYGTATVSDLFAHDCASHTIYNASEMTLDNAKIENAGSNALYNTDTVTASNLVINGTGNVACYNNNGGTMTVTNATITNTTKRAIYNRGGNVYVEDIYIDGTGTHAVANNVDEDGNPGTLEAVRIETKNVGSVSIYNEGYGVETIVRDSVLHPGYNTTVAVSYGSTVLENTKIGGTSKDKTYCVGITKGATCTITNCSLSGANSRGLTVHGTCTMTGGSISGCSSHASGGGAAVDGVLTMNGVSIYGNTATSVGGGIAVTYNKDDGLYGTLYMNNCYVSNNVGIGGTGGIYVSAGTTAVINGTVTGNTIADGSSSGIRFRDDGTIGSGINLGGGNELRIDAGCVVTINGNELSNFSAENPMLVTFSGSDGDVVFKTASEEAAANIVAVLKSTSKLELEASGSNIVIKEPAKETVSDLDMTGADTAKVTNYEELKAAVEAATGKLQITLEGDIDMIGTITLPENVTIQIVDDGTLRTISRNAEMISGALFEVPVTASFGLCGTSSDTLVVDGANVSVANAEDAVSQSSMIANRGVTILEHVTLQNSDTKIKGAAVSNYADASLKIVDAKLLNNTGTAGGAIWAEGGNVEIKDSVVSGNTASGSAGGAICADAGFVTAENTVFEKNTATNGGAIFAKKGASVGVEVIGCTFTENSATTSCGGAIDMQDGSKLTVTGCTFEKNTANNTATSGDGSYRGGGAINVANASADIASSTFKDNSTTGTNASGGAIHLYKLTSASATNVTITDGCVFENNTANLRGGAVYQYAGSSHTGTVIIDGATFTGNQAKNAYGGAITITGAKQSLTITNSAFHNNTSATGGGAINAAGGKDGNDGKGVIISDTTFNGNTISAATGGDQVTVSGSQKMVLTNVEIISADEGGNGYDVWVNAATSSLTVSGKTVLGETALGAEGVHVTVGEAHLSEGSSVVLCPQVYTAGLNAVSGANEADLALITVMATETDTWGLDASGNLVITGAVDPGEPTDPTDPTGPSNPTDPSEPEDTVIDTFEELKTAVAASAEAEDKTANIVVGGDIEFTETIAIPAGTTVIITDDGTVRTLSRGAALTGELFNVPADATLNLTATAADMLIVDGKSVEAQAALVVTSGTANLTNVHFCNGNNMAGIGGAVYLVKGSGTTTVTGCKFTGNSITGGNGGGAITVMDGNVLNVTDSTFADNVSNNTSESGAASYKGGAICIANASANIQSSTFKNNTANGLNASGGAIHLYKLTKAASTNVTVGGGCVFENNTANGMGGAIALYTNGDTHNGSLTIDGAAFIGNTSVTGHSGAVGISGAAQSLTIKNVTFDGNSAKKSGGAVNAAGGKEGNDGLGVILENCTFTGNTTDAASGGNAVTVSGGQKMVMTNVQITSAAEGGSAYDVWMNSAASSLTVSGDIALGEVCLNKEGTVVTIGEAHLTEGSSIVLAPLTYTSGVTVVSGHNETDLTMINVLPNGADLWAIDAEGKLVTAPVINAASADELKAAVAQASAELTKAVKIVVCADIEITESIVIPAGTTVTITDDGTSRTISRAVSLTGELFNVPADASLNLTGTAADMLIVNGEGVEAANAMLVTSGTTTLTNVAMSNGISTGATGGAVNAAGGILTATGSSFVNNQATEGGAIEMVANSGAIVNVNGCIFTGNKATSACGGAIHVKDGTTLNVQGSTFESNSAYNSATKKADGSYRGGGAISVANATLNVSSSVFKNNSCSGTYASGGAIHLYKLKTSVSITDNCVFEGNTSVANGGAIYLYATSHAGSVIVDGAVFAGNQSTSGHSGAIGITGASQSLTIKNSTFTGNASATYGGVINVAGGKDGNDGAGVIIENSTMSGSTSATADALMISNNQKLGLYNVTVTPAEGGSDYEVWMNGTGSELTVSGSIVLGTVGYKAEGTDITVGDAHLTEGSSIVLAPPAYTAETVVVTGASEADLAMIGVLPEGENQWSIDAEGKLAVVQPEAAKENGETADEEQSQDNP